MITAKEARTISDQHYLGNLPIKEYCDIIEKIEMAALEGLEYISYREDLDIITEKLLKKHGFIIYTYEHGGGNISWEKTCWQKIKTLLVFWPLI
jgi:hypothetical protein